MVESVRVRLRTILIGPTTFGKDRKSVQIPFGSLTASLDLEDRTEGPVVAVTGLFPGSAEDADSVSQDALESLRDATLLMIELVRWRLGAESWSGDTMRGGGSFLEWSEDGNTWMTISDVSHREVELVPSPAVLSDQTEEWLAALAASGAREPLAREIWHTALGAHKRHEYRTAIILAMNAVEVGLKQFIGSSIPQAEWFVLNAQMPPMTKVLRDFLPTLPGVDPTQLPDPKIRKVLTDAVERRNAFIHVGVKFSDPKPLPDKNESLKVLGAASDLLWLLDYYSGNDWALGRLGWAERQSLDYWFGPTSVTSSP